MDKNPEVVVTGVSIMKDVLEIRDRDYSLKLNTEMERLGKGCTGEIR